VPEEGDSGISPASGASAQRRTFFTLPGEGLSNGSFFRTLSPDVANTAPLTRREIADLLPEVPGWSLEDGHLTARFICKGFATP